MATRNLLEYYTPPAASSSYLRYKGSAPLGTPISDHAWHVERYTYGQAPDLTWKVVDFQAMDSVAWDDRASLPWAS